MAWWAILIIIVGVLLLLCFLLAVANFSGERFMEKYENMNRIRASKNISPMTFIAIINNKFFDGKLEIVQISNIASDYYSKGKLFLSTETLRIPSLASFTIISHEMGHAYQDKTGNKLKIMATLRRLGKTLGLLMMPSLIAGVLLLLFGEKLLPWGIALIALGVLIFVLALFIKLRMIAIEKDASNQAMTFLSEFFSEEELKQCKTFLNDARLTYWAEFLRVCLGWTAMSKKTKLFN